MNGPRPATTGDDVDEAAQRCAAADAEPASRSGAAELGHMAISVPIQSDDDVSFVHGFCRLVSDAARQGKPSEVFVVRIDNWFDVKWFGFAGKAKVGIVTGIASIDTEVQPFWKKRADITFPPFVPNRVLEQLYFRNEADSYVQVVDDARFVYAGEPRRSGYNLQNRVLDFSPSAMFIWFSSKSATNGRATVMYYHAHDGKLNAWYASFVRDDGWHIDRVRNIEKEVIERHFQAGVAEGAT